MSKTNLHSIILISLIFLMSSFIFAEDKVLTEIQKEAVAMVNKAGALLEKTGDEGLKSISNPEGDFYIKEKALYAFVYDENCVMLAHPYKPNLIGKSYKGKPDFKGKMFRDDIVKKAIENGDGWTIYTYQKPGDNKLHYKTAYGKLFKHNDKKYIVVSGVYKN